MPQVIIGVDPHKLSATIEVVDGHETVLAAGRFGTDKAGYAEMRQRVEAWPERTWAVEGSNGAGRSLAQRLVADGEQVVDVPAKLSARARLLDTGHNRKTDADDAHSVAVAAVRAKQLRTVAHDRSSGQGCEKGLWPRRGRDGPNTQTRQAAEWGISEPSARDRGLAYGPLCSSQSSPLGSCTLVAVHRKTPNSRSLLRMVVASTKLTSANPARANCSARRSLSNP